MFLEDDREPVVSLQLVQMAKLVLDLCWDYKRKICHCKMKQNFFFNLPCFIFMTVTNAAASFWFLFFQDLDVHVQMDSLPVKTARPL